MPEQPVSGGSYRVVNLRRSPASDFVSQSAHLLYADPEPVVNFNASTGPFEGTRRPQSSLKSGTSPLDSRARTKSLGALSFPMERISPPTPPQRPQMHHDSKTPVTDLTEEREAYRQALYDYDMAAIKNAQRTREIDRVMREAWRLDHERDLLQHANNAANYIASRAYETTAKNEDRMTRNARNRAERENQKEQERAAKAAHEAQRRREWQAFNSERMSETHSRQQRKTQREIEAYNIAQARDEEQRALREARCAEQAARVERIKADRERIRAMRAEARRREEFQWSDELQRLRRLSQHSTAEIQSSFRTKSPVTYTLA